jgi:hypothetical protein
MGDAGLRQCRSATQVVMVVRVASINDCVASLQQWLQLVEQGVDRCCRHHQPDCAWRLQCIHELCKQGGTSRPQRHLLRYAFGCPVVEHAIMAAAQQALGHAGTYAAQANHADLHFHAPFPCKQTRSPPVGALAQASCGVRN